MKLKSILFIVGVMFALAACVNKSTHRAVDVAEQNQSELLVLLDSVNCSCIVRNKGITTQYNQRGVRDLYELVTAHREVLRGAQVADKIIGKGAAALLVIGEVRRVDTHVVTTPALKMLQEADIEVHYEKEIPYVENRKKTGQCPLDERLQGIDSTHLFLPIIEQFIQDLNNGRVL